MGWSAVVLWDDAGGSSATLVNLQDGDELPVELVELLKDDDRTLTVSATSRANSLRRLAATLDAEALMDDARAKLGRLIETGSADVPAVAAD